MGSDIADGRWGRRLRRIQPDSGLPFIAIDERWRDMPAVSLLDRLAGRSVREAHHTSAAWPGDTRHPRPFTLPGALVTEGSVRIVMADRSPLGPGFYADYSSRRQLPTGLRLLIELVA